MNLLTLVDPWHEMLSHIAIKGALLLALALGLGLMLRQMSAGRRYVVWLSAVIALAVLPLVMPFLPAWRVLPQVSVPVEMPVMEPVMDDEVESVPELAVEPTTMPTAIKTPSQPVPVKVAAPAWRWSYSWQETLIMGWLSVASLLLLRLIYSVWRLRRLEGLCETGGCALITKLSREIGLRCEPRLVIGPRDAVPMVWGVWRPRLLLPLGFESWPEEKLSAVLLHELAHLKRGDPLALWAAQLMQVMHGINPLAWLTLRQLRADQERACDDTVLRHGVRASDYAQYLLDLSRQTRLAPGISFCALTVTRSAPVEQRVAAILDPQVQRDGATGRWALGLLAVVSLVVLPLAMLQAADAVVDLRGRILDRNGVVLAESTKEKVRHYPMKTLAAHMIGYTRVSGPKDDSPEGHTAIEKQQNAALKQGKDVSLSVDARIQSLAIQAMLDGGVTRGAAVVLDPRTGEILAAVSLPSYNPNVFIPSISQENWDVFNDNKDNPLMNRAVSTYAPGSCYMPLTALAGIAAGVGEQKFTCEGSVTYGSKNMQCWINRQNGGKHGELSMTTALTASCSCFWYQFGNAAGIEQIGKVGRKIGLGSRYGIDVDERAGIMPGPTWLKENHPGETWSPGYTANTSIGQGLVLATPLQLAVLAATVGNGGQVPEPSLMKKRGKTKWRADLTADGLPVAQIEQLREGMRLVVNGESGTGQSARSDKVVIAGKTGTAQHWRIVDGKPVEDSHAWFIGFAPFDKPTLAFAILKQGGKSGGADCAPIAKRVIEEVLALPADGSGEVKAVGDALGAAWEKIVAAKAEFDSKAATISGEIQKAKPDEKTGFMLSELKNGDGTVTMSGVASGMIQALEFRDKLVVIGKKHGIEWSFPVPKTMKDGKRVEFEAEGQPLRKLTVEKPEMTIEEMKKKTEELRALRVNRQSSEALMEEYRKKEQAEWEAFRQEVGLAELPSKTSVLRVDLKSATREFLLSRDEAKSWLRACTGDQANVNWLEAGERTGHCYAAKNGHEIEVSSAGPKEVLVIVSKANPSNAAVEKAFEHDIWSHSLLSRAWKKLRESGKLAFFPKGAREALHSAGVSSVAFSASREGVIQWLGQSLDGVVEVKLPEKLAFFRHIYHASNEVHIEVLMREGKEPLVIVWEGKRSDRVTPNVESPPASENSAAVMPPGVLNRRRTLISAPAVPVKESLPQPNRRRALIPMSFQQAAVGKPVGEALGPFGGGAGLCVGLVAEAVTGVGEDVQLSFDASGLVLEVEGSHAFRDVRPVAVASGDKERRQAFFSVEEARSAWIDERLEVGATGLLLDGVGGVFFASVGLHGGKSGQLTSGGEAEDADAVRLNVPLDSAAANGAYGAACIGHGVVLNGVGAAFFAGEPVFQHKGGDTTITEPLGERIAFMAEAELGMTTARADDDGCAGAFVRSGNVRCDGGVVDVADVAAFDLLSLSGAGFRAGSACGPKWQRAGNVGGEGEGLNAKREEENFHVGTIS